MVLWNQRAEYGELGVGKRVPEHREFSKIQVAGGKGLLEREVLGEEKLLGREVLGVENHHLRKAPGGEKLLGKEALGGAQKKRQKAKKLRLGKEGCMIS